MRRPVGVAILCQEAPVYTIVKTRWDGCASIADSR